MEVDIGGEFYGWGAGGAGNIKHICDILHRLGYEKVSAILDNDQLEIRNILSQMFTNYYFACIPADDVRFKTSSAREEKDGLLKDGLLQEKYREATKQVLSEVREYLGSIPVEDSFQTDFASELTRFGQRRQIYVKPGFTGYQANFSITPQPSAKPR